MPAIAKRGERLFVAAASAHAVGIHPHARIIGEPRPHFGLQLLRSQTAEAYPLEVALGARVRRYCVEIAIVAHGRVIVPMKRQRQVALRAHAPNGRRPGTECASNARGG